MAQIDNIRHQCLETMENQYATRMEHHVSKLELNYAEAILQELMVEAEDFIADDLFLDDLTEWSKDDLDNIQFYDSGDLDIDG